MKKTFKTIMAAMAVAVLFWPAVCFGQEGLEGATYGKFELISEQEYAAAQRDMLQCNIFPKKLSADSVILDQFLSRVIEMDDDARYVYSESKKGPDESDECNYDLFEMNSGDTTIYMLKFVSMVWDFCYLATKAADGTLYIPDVKIDSAPIVMSKDGYIAGFAEVGDGYWTQPTIYTYSLNKKTGELSITQIGKFLNPPGVAWKIHRCGCPGLAFAFVDEPHPAFWRGETLYMEGLRMPYTEDDIFYTDVICYYKLVVGEQKGGAK